MYESRIEALEAELAIAKSNNAQQSVVQEDEDMEKKTLKMQVQSLQIKNLELTQKIQEYENQAKDQNMQLARQDTASKDAKLNRALEELDKMRLQLKDARIAEVGKSDKMRQDMDKLVEANRNLEKQRNELLQAFKK